MRRGVALVLGAVIVVLGSCTSEDDQLRPVHSDVQQHPELIGGNSSIPSQMTNGGLLVEDLESFEWAWQWFSLDGPYIPTGEVRFRRDAVLFLATFESGDCPMRYEGFEIEGSTIRIQTKPYERMCNNAAASRSMVLRLPKKDLPDGNLEVAIEEGDIQIRRLGTSGRWLREAILKWFEDVPEKQLPERGVLGGTIGARVIGFPPDFSGVVGDEFLVQLEDGHVVATYRYKIRPSLFWKPQGRVRYGEPQWKRLQAHRGFEVWEEKPTYLDDGSTPPRTEFAPYDLR